MAKRQLDSFKAQLDAAVSEADLDLVEKEMSVIRQAAEKQAANAKRAVSASPGPK